MKKQAFNPYLPLEKYICDGEAHVFGDRLYVFGSQDREGGTTFCELDYEVFSAPVDDLSDWQSEGLIYSANRDPHSTTERKYLYAPDVVQGADGRYYLYYALSCAKGKGGFDGPISVAVCDTPAGKYSYYGDVKMPDGEKLPFIPFDPAVLNDNGRIWLYYGWSLPLKRPRMPFGKTAWRIVMQRMFHRSAEEIKSSPQPLMGANAVELESDMLTVADAPRRIIPAPDEAVGTSFEGHAFFEASSIRKVGEEYYFVYSTQANHELCYARSRFPDREFEYGGVLVSSGDVGIAGRSEKQRVNMTGNNHGCIEQVNGRWYVFYHRHTHASSYSRQCCAEEIFMDGGNIKQVEISSCGLNGGPLSAEGEYSAALACQISNGRMPHGANGFIKRRIPHITSGNGERYITGIRPGTVVGFKYFDFSEPTEISIVARGRGSGGFCVYTDGGTAGEIPLSPSTEWRESEAVTLGASGKQPLLFRYEGRGEIELLSVRLTKRRA